MTGKGSEQDFAEKTGGPGALGSSKKVSRDVLECPPNARTRRFNECDIIGALNRDDKGNVIVGDQD